MKKPCVHHAVLALMLVATAAFAQQRGDAIKGIGEQPAAKAQPTHKATAMVKKVDRKAGTVTLVHEPVKSLNWPAMTMGFKVTDKKLLDKLGVGNKVEVEFMQVNKDYVVMSVE